MSGKARVLFVCVANAARFKTALHEIHERIRMFVRVKGKTR